MKVKEMLEFIQKYNGIPPETVSLYEVIREAKKAGATKMQLNYLLNNIFA